MCDNAISAKNPDLIDQAIKILEEKKASAKVSEPPPSQKNEPKESKANAHTSEKNEPNESNSKALASENIEPKESNADRAECITK